MSSGIMVATHVLPISTTQQLNNALVSVPPHVSTLQSRTAYICPISMYKTFTRTTTSPFVPNFRLHRNSSLVFPFGSNLHHRPWICAMIFANASCSGICIELCVGPWRVFWRTMLSAHHQMELRYTYSSISHAKLYLQSACSHIIASVLLLPPRVPYPCQHL